MANRGWLMWLVVLVGCDAAAPGLDPDGQVIVDAGAPDAGHDVGLDAGPDLGLDAAPDAALDAAPDGALDGTEPDAALDASDPDAAEPDAGPLSPPIDLVLADAVGGDPLGASRVIGLGDALEWGALPPASGAYAVQVSARQWRREDGALTVDFGDGPRPAQLFGQGVASWRTVREPEFVGAGTATTYPPLVAHDPGQLRITTSGGTLQIDGVRLVDPRAVEPVAEPIVRPAPTVEASPCGCDDDGAALSALVAEQPEGPVVLALAPGEYHLRTPLRLGRSSVWVLGERDTTVLIWDPSEAASASAIEVVGGQLGAPVSIDGPVVADVRTLALGAPLPEPLPAGPLGHAWVELSADDFGEVPRTCVNGRDVERFQRHTRHLARVLRAQPDQVVLDRPIGVDLPADSAPRLRPFVPTTGGVVGLTLRAACPQAIAHPNFSTPQCDNPLVVDDSGLVLRRTAGFTVADVTIEAFGQYGVAVFDAVETHIEGVTVHHFSNFGDGGRGYGVHLIQASRSMLRGLNVERARHSVVVDFGSADSQVLDSDLRRCRLAVVDVHGEASRDVWVRGNRLADSGTGVIVGGGGNQVHCNDGPRHHVEWNTVSGTTLAALQVGDATLGVWFRHNDISAAPFALFVLGDAGDVTFEGNRVWDVPIPVQASTAGRVRVTRNDFVDVCDPAMAARASNAELVVEDDNRYCP